MQIGETDHFPADVLFITLSPLSHFSSFNAKFLRIAIFFSVIFQQQKIYLVSSKLRIAKAIKQSPFCIFKGSFMPVPVCHSDEIEHIAGDTISD